MGFDAQAFATAFLTKLGQGIDTRVAEAKEFEKEEREKAKKRAAKQFQKDWKSKRKKQAFAERNARAKVEQANLQAQTIQNVSDDALLARMAESTPPPLVRGSSQLDQFEQSRFG